jgi:DNA adenine methylase
MKCGNCRQEGHTKRTCTQPVHAEPSKKATKVEPAKPKAAKKAVKPNVAKVEPAKVEPAKVEPAQVEPAKKQENTIVKPPLKWVGGKTQIIHQVLALFPRTMKNYVEPFLGGGSVLLALLSMRQQGLIEITGTIYASDMNPNTIGFYQNLQSHREELVEALQTIAAEYTAIDGTVVNRKATEEEAKSSRESYYYWIRSTFNALSQEDKVKPRGSAMLLFLNKTCFRGLYRQGPHGLNVPFEKQHQNPTIYEEAHLQQVSELIQGVVFTCQPFEALSAEEGDFVYMDPPYVPETAKSFVAYNADGFTRESHDALFELCHTLTKKKVRLLMSNADVPLVRETFLEPRYETQIIEVRRAIHSKKPGAKTNEVLISNRT